MLDMLLLLAPLDVYLKGSGILQLIAGHFLAVLSTRKPNRERVLVQNGLYFFMMLAVGLLASLGAAVTLAAIIDLKEKLGRR